MPDILEIIGNGPGVTGTTTDFIPFFDVGAYSYFSMTLSGTFNLTLQYQFADDPINGPWNPGLAGRTDNSSFSLNAANGVVPTVCPKYGRYLRIRPSVFVSNTSLVGVLHAYEIPTFPLASLVTAIQSGVWTFGPFATGATPTTNSSGNQANFAKSA